MQQQNLNTTPYCQQQYQGQQENPQMNKHLSSPVYSHVPQRPAFNQQQQPYLLHPPYINPHSKYIPLQYLYTALYSQTSPRTHNNISPHQPALHQLQPQYAQYQGQNPWSYQDNAGFPPNNSTFQLYNNSEANVNDNQVQGFIPQNLDRMQFKQNINQLRNQQQDIDQIQLGQIQSCQSPPNEEIAGYYLPDYIENEINNKGSNVQVLAQKESSDPYNRQSPQNSIGTNDNQSNINMLEQKMCQLCKVQIQPNEKVLERKIENNMIATVHSHCFVQQSLNDIQDTDEEQSDFQPFVRLQNQVPQQPKSFVPEIQITPDMLVFDFQMVHPMTQTSIFSLTNQSANYVQEPSNSYSYNKLLCNSTAVPFNMVIVKFRWDFFRDPDSMYEQKFMQNQQLPKLPIISTQRNIQGLANFYEMQNHKDKNLTITLKATPFEQNLMTNEESSTLHLNFNYNNLQEQQMEQFQEGKLPIVHILKNLYLSFSITEKDYMNLKQETVRMIHYNPNLQLLLKPSMNTYQDNSKFMQTQPSLHQLFQGAQQKDFQQNQLNSQFQQLNFRQSNNATDKLEVKNYQKQTGTPVSNQQKSQNTQNSDLDSIENYAQEHFLGVKNNKCLPRKQNSDNSLSNHSSQNQRKDVEEEKNIKNQYYDQTQESQNLKKALTLEVSTFDGEFVKQQNKQKMKNVEQSTSLGCSPKTNFIEPLNQGPSPSNLSSTDFINFNDSSQSTFLNPQTANKKKSSENSTLQVQQKGRGERKGSTGHVSSGAKKSKKSSSGSIKSRGSSSRGSTSNSRLEEENPDNALLAELKGQVIDMARQQHGSKYLQKLLARASPDFINFAIEESLDQLHQLMVDQYGNYFCQKLLQSSSSAQRLKILKKLCPNFYKISIDRKGTHSMQCLIEMVNMADEEEELKNSIKDIVIDLAFNANGTHVLQKVLLCMKEESIDFIFDPVYENLIDLSMDQNGLCVIKKLISKIQGHEKRLKLGEKLSNHVVELVQSPYGNYAVQQALDNWPRQYCLSIFQKLEPHLMQLSVQKFSSNVIEKVLENSEYETVERYTKVLLNFEVMKSLIKNTYGFYVIQKLKEILKKHKKQTKQIYQVVEETICYVSDKSLKSKWQQLLSSY